MWQYSILLIAVSLASLIIAVGSYGVSAMIYKSNISFFRWSSLVFTSLLVLVLILQTIHTIKYGIHLGFCGIVILLSVTAPFALNSFRYLRKC